MTDRLIRFGARVVSQRVQGLADKAVRLAVRARRDADADASARGKEAVAAIFRMGQHAEFAALVRWATHPRRVLGKRHTWRMHIIGTEVSAPDAQAAAWVLKFLAAAAEDDDARCLELFTSAEQDTLNRAAGMLLLIASNAEMDATAGAS